MKRTFRPFDLVQLPNLDALGAQTLGAEVIAVAAGKTLPPPIAEALADLTTAHQALKEAAEQRLPADDGSDPLAGHRADIALDAAWRALFTLLKGWSKVPDHPRADVAAALLGQLFPDGLRFTQLPFKLEWAESDTRLRFIDGRGLDKDLEGLGATAALEQVRKLHAQYGEVLDITTSSDPPSTNLRDAITAFRDSLRVYVVRVAASERQQDPSSTDLALELVAPIERWEGSHGATNAAPAPTPTPPPAPTPAPPAEPPVAAPPTTTAR